MDTLTTEEFEELDAIADVWDICNKRGILPMPIMKHHWHNVTGRLARRGFITWKKPASDEHWLPHIWRRVRITDKGRAALAKARGEQAEKRA